MRWPIAMRERRRRLRTGVAMMAGAMLAQPAFAHDADRPTSLVTEYAPLEKLAAAGDAAAARQLAADFRRCEAARSQQHAIRPGDSKPHDERSESDALFCAGYDDDWQDGRVYHALWLAAKLGDESSAACYVATPYFLTHGSTYDEARPEIYAEHARELLTEAISKGQWRVVSAAYGVMQMNWVDWAPLSAAINGRPDQTYGLQRLLLLGAAPDAKADIRELHRPFIDGRGRQLTDPQKRDAEQWAQATFARYYRSNPRSTPLLTPCTDQPMFPSPLSP